MLNLKSLTARLRTYVGNRRAAPRYATHLEKALVVYIYLNAPDTGRDGGRPTPRLVGYTRDVSETGLGVVVPEVRINGRNIVGAERTLHVLVGLKPAPVEMSATAVRYVEPEAGDGDGGDYLVGVHIREMPAPDRARYMKFINSLEVGEI